MTKQIIKTIFIFAIAFFGIATYIYINTNNTTPVAQSTNEVEVIEEVTIEVTPPTHTVDTITVLEPYMTPEVIILPASQPEEAATAPVQEPTKIDYYTGHEVKCFDCVDFEPQVEIETPEVEVIDETPISHGGEEMNEILQRDLECKELYGFMTYYNGINCFDTVRNEPVGESNDQPMNYDRGQDHGQNLV